jgi:uncharacterized coiled-coil protein SlyX
MPDTPGLGRPQQDDDPLLHTLTVHDVSERIAAAGVPRSERQIKRYCESGFLDAKKVPGPTGDQWFIAPAALPKLIGDLEQWNAQRAGQGRPHPAMSTHVNAATTMIDQPATPGLGRPQQDATELQQEGTRAEREPDTAGLVTQLETRISEKDEVIDLLKGQLAVKDQQITDLSTRYVNLSDRFADTQKLLGAMQRMFAPLLGLRDPYAAASDSEPAGEPYRAPVDNTQPHA